MKAVILAGGYGTRLSEETTVIPKPMVEIGNYPILWHIMKIFSAYGVDDFIICCGYKGQVIKRFFADYWLHHSDLTVDLKNHTIRHHRNGCEPWKVTLIDTGEATMTGGRLKRVREHLDGGTFFLTYGDGVADVDIGALLAFHRSQDLLATVTAVKPPGRFGALSLDSDQQRVLSFREKPTGDGSWINGGFYVLEPEVIDYVDGDDTVWEREPMERLARDRQLSAHLHRGFWQPMDTLRDKHVLEELWEAGNPPWRVWDASPPSGASGVSTATDQSHDAASVARGYPSIETE
jgi:glucose-1-phosphate cytidylyltransferase